jgi:hypothetical protein
MKATGRPLGSKNAYRTPHRSGRKPTNVPDFMRELVKRAKVRPLNATPVPWIYDCEVGVCRNTAHYKIFGDTYICSKDYIELQNRLMVVK